MSDSKRPFYGKRLLRPSQRVAPFRVTSAQPGPVTQFRLGLANSPMFDIAAQAIGQKVGVEIEWYVQDVQGSVRDPLYDEPIERRWLGPYTVIGKVELPDKSSSVTEEGYQAGGFQTMVWLARAEVEQAGMPVPRSGDVFRVWNVPYFDAQADEQGLFFDVTSVGLDGVVYDGPTFVLYKIIGQRNTRFTPERRLEG